MAIDALLAQLVHLGGSDLHLKAGSPPLVRVDGALRPLDAPSLADGDTDRLASQLLSPAKQEMLRDSGDAEAGLSRAGLGRFRMNAFVERGRTRLVFRRVLTAAPSIEDLNLPYVVARIAEERRGLILVTGPAGMGKTTTIAAMIGLINRSRYCHVMTIEDPIEVVFEGDKALIDQREIGLDVPSYAAGMKYVVRQDPDVIFIGEIRDRETAEAAIQAAETGHLVISTMHTKDATETVNRVIDLFPFGSSRQVRISLASVLRGVICQRLLPKIDGTGRVPAAEVLVATGRVVERILDPSTTVQIKQVIQEGGYYGMQTFDQSLLSLVEGGYVSAAEARLAATNPHDFDLSLKQAQLV